MDNFSTSTSHNESYNYSNITDNHDDNFDMYNYLKSNFNEHVATCIIIAIGLPLILLAIYSLYSLVRNDNVAPIYVINLLISDLIQLCCMIGEEAQKTDEVRLIFIILRFIHLYSVSVSVGFMVCIALQRYLLIAHPLWYRFRRTIKISVVVCVFVWVVPLVPLLTLHLWDELMVSIIVTALILLLPFPLFIFFLGGTLKALSASRSVLSDEKRRIVGILVLVLLNYTVLFLPFILFLFSYRFRELYEKSLYPRSFMFLKFSPLADLVLYIFMRKGAIDKLLASLCCCRMDSNDVISP